jgi:large subunit ribosomal protein L9
MRIILAEDVVGVGDIGEIVTVRPGFARNFLIPRGAAMEVGAAQAHTLEHKKRQIEAKKKRLRGQAQEVAQKIRDLALEIGLKVGSSGRVFGSITPKDIAEKLTLAGFEVDRRRVILAEPIKKLGMHFVKVRLHPEVESQLKLSVVEVKATEEEEQAVVKRVKEKLEVASDERNAAGEAEAEDAE